MPEYNFPKVKFFPFENDVIIDRKNNKRYVLPVEIKASSKSNETWLIILKNPSKAGKVDINESDCTINRVCNYFYINKKEVKRLIIMNLFPVFLTDADKLQNLPIDYKIDEENKRWLKNFISKVDNIVLAWGSHPANCFQEFEEMKKFVNENLNGKNIYQLEHPKRELNYERPLHGQVWGYDYKLQKIK